MLLLIFVAIMILLIVADFRAASLVEGDLIEMFETLPKDFKTFLKSDATLYKNFYTTNYQS